MIDHKEKHESEANPASADDIEKMPSIESTDSSYILTAEDERLIEESLDWKKPITLRACLCGACIGFFIGWIQLKIYFTSPVSPSFAVVVGLFSFVILRALNNLLPVVTGFNKRENTVAQTVATMTGLGSSILGFDCWYGALSKNFFEDIYPDSVVDIGNVGHMYANSFALILPGVFLLTFLFKFMATHEYLVFPSGTASGVTMNSFHNKSKEVAELVQKQLYVFWKWAAIAGLFELFFFNLGIPENMSDTCSPTMPLFGLEAFNKYGGLGGWDMLILYIGVGILLPLDFNWSIVVGLMTTPFFNVFLASKGCDIQYPSLDQPWTEEAQQEADKIGCWYSNSDNMTDGMPNPAMRQDLAYLVFPFAFVMIGEGAIYIIDGIIAAVRARRSNDKIKASEKKSVELSREDLRERERRNQVVQREKPISTKIALPLYAALAVIGTVVLWSVYRVTWWVLLLCYFILAPMIAVPNLIFIGIQDQDNSAIMGKITMLLIPMIIVSVHGDESKGEAVIAGCIAEGIIIGICYTSGQLMQDFKTAYMTETAPKTLFYAQLVGCGFAFIFGPLAFIVLDAMYDITGTKEEMKIPEPVLWEPYRGIAMVGAYGSDLLPKNALMITFSMTAAAVVVAAIREWGPRHAGEHGWVLKYIFPSPTAIAITLYLGFSTNSDFPIGGLIGLLWKMHNPVDYKNFHQIFAAALIVGPAVTDLVMQIISTFAVTGIFCVNFLGDY